MNSCYHNILVPIGNSLNAKKAVDKAMILANPCRSTIHLAQLMPAWNPFTRLVPATAYTAGSKDALDGYIKTLLNLMRWKDLIEKNGHVAQVKIHIMRGPSNYAFIRDLTQRTRIDLIIFANNQKSRWLPGVLSVSGNKIARESQCAVLSINSEKRRGIKQEAEILSEPLRVRYAEKHSDDKSSFGLTGVYDLLSSN